ncbi:class I lanthipeptide [Aquimarina sp. M1]
MKKTKKLSLSKITVSRLTRNEKSSIYGGTIDKGCGTKSIPGKPICPDSDGCAETIEGPQCN